MTSDGASLAALIARLETVAQRLESVKGASSGGDAVEQPSETTHTQPASPAAAAHQDSTVADWDAQIAVLVNSLAAAGDGIGAEVAKVSQVVQAAFQEERKVVEAITTCKVPDAAGLQQLVQATGQQLMAANEIADNRRSPAFNHAKAAAEALQGLTWVIYTGPNCGMSLPAKHVAESWQSAEFYANKVLMQHRQSGLEHVQWVQLLKQLLQALGAYVQQHHKAGPAWRPNGTTVAEFLASGPPAGATAAPASSAPAPSQPAPPSPPAAPPAPPAPPPPPPGGPGSLLKDAVAKQQQAAPAKPAAGGMSAVFSSINKGGDVTSGLKKVTDDMKTKNRADRSGSIAAAAPAAAPAAPSTSGAQLKKGPSRGPPRMECEQGGRKWVIENHTGAHDIVLEDTNPKQGVYIFGCQQSTIQIRGKVNAISMDQCKKTGLVFEDVVSSCELVNSSGVQAQVTGNVPTFSIDKCDGVQIFISQAAAGAEIFTAKASEVNISLLRADGEDPSEHALPEQFVSRFVGGRLVTEAVSHGGG